MSAVIEFLAAAWPLVLVVGLAVVFIRGARGPRRPRPAAKTEHENGAWARSEWSAGRPANEDRGGSHLDGGGGGGAGDGGGGGD